MLLAIDIGNTNAVFAVFDGGGAVARRWRVETSALLDGFDLDVDGITDVIVSSVVPDVDAKLTEACQEKLGAAPLFITKEHVPIELDLERPEEVGADRLVNALAVTAHYSTPAIVIDFGTATTFDVIDGRGVYRGGVIAPGVNLSVETLHRAAAKLPKIRVEKPEYIIGKSTEQAMQSGMYWGYCGLIEKLVSGIAAELNAAPLVLATGGLAKLFADGSDVIDQVDPDLTLKGLYEIYKIRNETS